MMEDSRNISYPLICSCCFILACTCVPEAAVQGVLVIDAEPPQYVACKALSPTQISFSFSEAVTLSSLSLSPPVEVTATTEGKELVVTLSEDLPEGESMFADLLVEDEAGNTLSALIPFRSRNARIPKLLITELRTEYSKPKVEFIEFRCETDGQLGALRVFTTASGFDEALYEFPRCEVLAGEYIVLHLRTLDAEHSIDELGSDVSLSGGVEAQSTARDFWIPDSTKRLRKNDVLFFLDQDDRVLDALMFCELTEGSWEKEEFIQAAALLSDAKAWKADSQEDLSPSSAVNSTGTTPSRTICRDETLLDSDSVVDWYVCATGCATPGGPNRRERYLKSGS